MIVRKSFFKEPLTAKWRFGFYFARQPASAEFGHEYDKLSSKSSSSCPRTAYHCRPSLPHPRRGFCKTNRDQLRLNDTGRGPIVPACSDPGRVQLGCRLAIAAAQLNLFLCAPL